MHRLGTLCLPWEFCLQGISCPWVHPDHSFGRQTVLISAPPSLIVFHPGRPLLHLPAALLLPGGDAVQGTTPMGTYPRGRL